MVGALTLVALLVAFSAPATAGAEVTGSEPFNQFASEGSAAGQLNSSGDSESMATDPVTGHVYVASRNGYSHRIDEFTPWGEFVKAFGYDVAPGPVNEQQEVRVRASGGQFRLGFASSTTGDLPHDASGAEVEAALLALPSIGAAGGTVSVRSSPGTATGSSPYVYVVTFKGSLSGTDVAQLSIEDGTTPLSGDDQPVEREVRTRADGTSGGTGLESCTTESGCQPGMNGTLGGQIFKASGLTVDSTGDIYVFEAANARRAEFGVEFYDQNLRMQKFDSAGRFLFAYGGDVISDGASGTGDLTAGSTEISNAATTSRAFEVGQAITGSGIPSGTTITAVGPGTITISQPAAATASGVAISAPEGAGNVSGNETQTLSLQAPGGGTPTGGTFTLQFISRLPSYAKETSDPIPAGASAAELQAALEEMPAIGSGNVAVTGAAGGPWAIEFTGSLFSGGDVYPLVVNIAQLLPAKAGGPISSVDLQAPMLTSVNPVEICLVAADCRGGAPGTRDGQFNQSRIGVSSTGDVTGGTTAEEDYIDTASDGTVFVADRERVQRFDPDGHFAGQFALPEPGTPRALALDPTENFLYLVYVDPKSITGGAPGVRKLDATSGAVLGTLSNESPRGVAVDPDGNVYSVGRNGQQYEALSFSRSGTPLSSCCQTEKAPGSGEYFRIGALATNSVGTLYVFDNLPSKGTFVRAYGPSPNELESPPLRPPSIEAQYASSVASASAVLGAQINPHFWADTRYYVQYGTAGCLEAGWSAGCVEHMPAPPGNLVSTGPVGRGTQTQAVVLTGLVPQTTYRYRFVAGSTGGGPVFGQGGTPAVEGTMTSFTTPAARAPASTDCANQPDRHGPSLALPDCRAYEMVSPLDKAGGNITTTPNLTGHWAAVDQSATDGGRITYSSYRAFAGALSSPATSQYLATRGPDGWTTKSLNAPEGNAVNSFNSIMTDAEYRAFTPDLGRGFMLFHSDPLTANAASDRLNLYRTDVNEGGFTPMISSTDSALDNSEVAGNGRFLDLGAISADGSRAAFTYAGRLTEDAIETGSAQIGQVYEWSRRGLRLASVLPNGLPSTQGASAGSFAPLPTGLETRQLNVVNALSADGHLYWTTPTVPNGNNGAVYVRVDGEVTLPVSSLISADPADFLQASSDGSRVAVMTTRQSVETLYLVEPEESRVTKVAGEVGGFMGASQSLDYLYFVSREDLAAGATAGAGNLYVAHDGEVTYVTTLTGADAISGSTDPEVSDVARTPWKRTSRVSPDGRHALFMSTDSLTGYDNVDTPSGERAAEVFLYDAPADELICVSCDRSGARPRGSRLYPNGATESRRRKPLTAAWIPTWAMQFYAQRVLSDDGKRVFFNSFVPLVPWDTNGMQDVYQWEAEGTGGCRQADGCIDLISTGQGAADTEFVDASVDGDDVFIRTSSSLDPRDPGSIDIYDARVGGASVPEQSRRAPCVGDSCQSPPQSPVWSDPASSAFHGPGNVRRTGPDQKSGCNGLKRRAGKLRRQSRALRRRSKRNAKGPQAKRLTGRARRLAAKAERIGKSAKRCHKTTRGARR